jgi:dipeptide/tripeptide permease
VFVGRTGVSGACSAELTGCSVLFKMEQAKPPKNALAVVAGGIAWGSLSALAITVLDRYNTHQTETTGRVVSRFGIFIAFGIVVRFFRWPDLNNREFSRTEVTARSALYICLMLGLAYLYWTMIHR